MKSLSRNVALTLFLAFAIWSIYGCAEKPITFAGPGVQIWKLNIVYDSGVEIKDQTSDFSRLISTPLCMQSQVPDCKKQRVDVGHRESSNALCYHNVKRNSTKK
jgi:hypothetical protein